MTVYCNDQMIAGNVRYAKSFFQRLVGLMGKKSLGASEGLLLATNAVHCFFMRFPIDVVYLSRDHRVLDTQTLAPWRVGRLVPKTHFVLELGAGQAAAVAAGDTLEISNIEL